MKKNLKLGIYLVLASMVLTGCNMTNPAITNATTTNTTMENDTEIIIIENIDKDDNRMGTIADAMVNEIQNDSVSDKNHNKKSEEEVISAKYYNGFDLRWEIMHTDSQISKDVLKKVIKDNTIIAEYEYDKKHRISKTVNGITTNFTYEYDDTIYNIMHLASTDDGVNKIEYIYDSYYYGDYHQGTFVDGFRLNGEEYFFLYNDQIITGIEKDGKAVARYLYDGQEFIGTYKMNEVGEWVLCKDEDFVGNINKVRFTDNMYYDDETGWYCFGFTYYDPVKERGVGGFSSDEYNALMLDMEAGVPVDSKYDNYKNSYFLMEMRYDATYMPPYYSYTTVEEHFTGARYQSKEWKILKDTEYVKEQYTAYAGEYSDRRYLEPHMEAGELYNEEVYVYEGTTEGGENVKVSYISLDEVEVNYRGEIDRFAIPDFSKTSEFENISPAHVFFYDMTKDGREELVMCDNAILVYDLEKGELIKYFDKDEKNRYAMSDEDVLLLDNMLKEVLPEHEYYDGVETYQTIQKYKFRLEDDKIIFYRTDRADNSMKIFNAEIIYEHNGSEITKSYTMNVEIDMEEESSFVRYFSEELKKSYISVKSNDNLASEYEKIWGEVNFNKEWLVKISYDNVDFDNYAIEVYSEGVLISRTFRAYDATVAYTLGEGINGVGNGYADGEYTLLYNLKLGL